MALKIEPGRAPAEELKRIALELLDDALRRMRSRSVLRRARNTHEIRKRLKELRAVVRLLDPGSRGKWVLRLLRDLGRELSETREGDSALETLRALRLGRRLGAGTLASIRERLAGDVVPADLGTLRARAAAAREEIGRWRVEPNNFENRIGRTYRKARQAMMRAIARHDADDLHEWRKAAKELWYQSLLLGAIPALHERQKQLHELSRTLGDHHDLALLCDAIVRHGPELDPAAAAIVLQAASSRSVQLERKATSLGVELFGERTKVWSRRLSAAGNSTEEPSPVIVTG